MKILVPAFFASGRVFSWFFMRTVAFRWREYAWS